jgi:hypothetical protein
VILSNPSKKYLDKGARMNVQIATPIEFEHTYQTGPDLIADASRLRDAGTWWPLALVQPLFRSGRLRSAKSGGLDTRPCKKTLQGQVSRFEDAPLLELNGIWLLKLAFGI